MLSGLGGDDHPGGGGMNPSEAVDELGGAGLLIERCTESNGEFGLEVKMNDGVSATCCSVCLFLIGSRDGATDSTEDMVGDGDGGRTILDCERAFPFDLVPNQYMGNMEKLDC